MRMRPYINIVQRNALLVKQNKVVKWGSEPIVGLIETYLHRGMCHELGCR
jgi:hypothetical protein